MIVFDGVSKTFRRRPVLDGVDLRIGRGDRVALVGSNGAGKTTLIRCLLGEYTRLGRVAVDGLDPRLRRAEVLGRIGFVPQLPPPLKMPVGELIRFAAGVCGAEAGRMEAVAGRLGLDVAEVRGQPFVKLSGGQKQKLLIGLAMGRDTDILVMDEPAANLDPAARRMFFELLAGHRDGTTMLISSHRLDEVAALVNRVVELDRGRVVLDDHVEDAVDLAAMLACRIVIARPDPAFARAFGEWRFTVGADGLTWQGTVAGADRLRFLGTLSRYAGIVRALALDEERR